MKKRNIYLILFLILTILNTSCRTDHKKVILNNSPLIYYVKTEDQIDFYHEKFDNLEDSVNFFNEEGIKLAKQNDTDKSRQAFIKGLNKSPQNVIILNNLANLERDSKNFKKSIEYYKKSFFESDSLYFVASLNLARTLSIIGEDIESEKEFYNIINNSKLDFIKGIAYYQLADSHLRYGNIQEANKVLKKAKKLLKEYSDFDSDLKTIKEKLDNYYK